MSARTFMISRTKTLIGLLFISVLAMSAAVFGNAWVAVPLTIPAFLLLPGFLIQLATRKELPRNLNTLLYSFGLSVGYWLVAGIFVNEVLPLLGISRPLTLPVLIPMYILTVGIM